jgi:hypothetical protein
MKIYLMLKRTVHNYRFALNDKQQNREMQVLRTREPLSLSEYEMKAKRRRETCNKFSLPAYGLF